MKINPRAGQPAASSDLVDVPKLLAAYYDRRPDAGVARQRVVFGTSGHRGSSFDSSFNEDHILAILRQSACTGGRPESTDHFSWGSTLMPCRARLRRAPWKCLPRMAWTR